MRKRTGIGAWAAVGLMLVVGVVLGVSSAAEAAYSCGTNHHHNEVCLYQNPNYGGSVADEPVLQQSYGNVYDFRIAHFTNGKTLDNQISSIINDTDQSLVIRQDPNNGYPAMCIPPHFALWDLWHVWTHDGDGNTNYQSFDNLASAAERVHDCGDIKITNNYGQSYNK